MPSSGAGFERRFVSAMASRIASDAMNRAVARSGKTSGTAADIGATRNTIAAA